MGMVQSLLIHKSNQQRYIGAGDAYIKLAAKACPA